MIVVDRKVLQCTCALIAAEEIFQILESRTPLTSTKFNWFFRESTPYLVNIVQLAVEVVVWCDEITKERLVLCSPASVSSLAVPAIVSNSFCASYFRDGW